MPTQLSLSTVQAGVTWLGDTVDRVVEETLRVCRIPAPTFDEAERAAYVAERMCAIGLHAVHIDEISNVTGLLGHGADHPTTLVVAHTDTVFPRATPLEVSYLNHLVYAYCRGYPARPRILLLKAGLFVQPMKYGVDTGEMFGGTYAT